MGSESNVSVAPDSTASGAHNIRTITVQVDNSGLVAGGQSEQQQVVTLADSAGHIVDLIHGAVPVWSEEMVVLLSAVLMRLDTLCALIDSRYEPPDDLGLNEGS